MFQLPSATGVDIRTSVVREMITYRVQRDITCRYSGRVLDIRTCIALVGGPDGDDVLAVISPDAWSALPDHDKVIRELAINHGPAVSVWIGRTEQSL